MSISKEERDELRNSLWRDSGPVTEHGVERLLDALDAADERIGELQAENERLRRYMDYEPKESK